jgi:hypothetical protein
MYIGLGDPRIEGKDGGVLTNIFVCELMTESHTLRLVLHGLTIDNGLAELFDDGFVDGVALEDVSWKMSSREKPPHVKS